MYVCTLSARQGDTDYICTFPKSFTLFACCVHSAQHVDQYVFLGRILKYVISKTKVKTKLKNRPNGENSPDLIALETTYVTCFRFLASSAWHVDLRPDNLCKYQVTCIA
jgi:hypothetical protein